MAGKTALVVFAHTEVTSFNGALRDVAVNVLQKQGYKVLISDLYEQNFRPVLSRLDIKGGFEGENFNYVKEIGDAYLNDKISDDVKAEMEKLKAADLVIFQFPVQWFSVPAILKGWFDRVLVSEFAFKFPNNLMENGLMKGKKAVLSFTTGSPGQMYTPNGLAGDLNTIFWPIQYGTLRFVGFDVLKPQCSFGPGLADDTQRKEMLKNWETRLMNINSEKPLEFPPLSSFDASKWFTDFTEEAKKANKGSEYGFSVAHHVGKKVPKS